MAGRISSICARAPRFVLAVLALAALGLGAYAISVPDGLALGGGSLSGSESAEAEENLASELSYDPEAAYLLVLGSEAPLPDATVDISVEALTTQIESLPGVRAVSEGERSAVGAAASLGVHLDLNPDPSVVSSVGEALAEDLDPGPLQSLLGGTIAVQDEARTVVSNDAPKLAALVTPLLLLLLAGALGLRPALATLLGIVLATAGTVAALGILGEIAELRAVAVVAGGTLAALLAAQAAAGVLYRYREESATLGGGAEALEYTLHVLLRTAATGMVSAVLVGVALLVIPIDFVRSVGAGIIVGGLLGAPLGLLPMAAGISLRPQAEVGVALPLVPDDARVEGAPRSFRALLSVGRTRRRGALALLPLIAVAVLAVPLLDSSAIGLSATELPADSEPAQAEALLSGTFGLGASGPLQVVTDGPGEAPTVTIYRDAVARLPTVESVSRAMSVGGSAVFEAAPDSRPQSLAAQRTADEVRSVSAPSPRQVGGPAAELHDSGLRLGDDLPLVGLFALLGTAALWSLVFRSAFGPALALTALVAPLAGIAAMIVIFGDGRLSELLDYQASGAPHLQSYVIVGAVLLAVGLTRGADLASALREERILGGGAAGSLARSNLLTLMPIAIASLVGIALAGVWVGSELLGAKELAVGLVAGLVADLLLARMLLAPAIARLSL